MKKVISKRFLAMLCMAALLVSFSLSPASAADKININTASVEQLQNLENIGPVKANGIVKYREAKPFQSIEEIKKVKGIGEKIFQSIKDKITVK